MFFGEVAGCVVKTSSSDSLIIAASMTLKVDFDLARFVYWVVGDSLGVGEFVAVGKS
jgi:hypothetical protein